MSELIVYNLILGSAWPPAVKQKISLSLMKQNYQIKLKIIPEAEHSLKFEIPSI